MIEPIDKALEYYHLQCDYFEEFIITTKQENIKFRQKFLSEKFVAIKYFKEDCYSSFYLQFIPYFDFLAFSKNEEDIISKLKELGFTNSSLKYLTDIDEIGIEIRKLLNFDGLVILPFNYIVSIHSFLTIKFKMESYESFFGIQKYNGVDVNNLYLESFRRSRRKNNISRLQEQDYEKYMIELNNNFDELLKIFFDEAIESKKMMLKILIGNYNVFIYNIQFQYNGISKNIALEALFPLFKTVFRDKKLLDEKEFIAYHNELLKSTGEKFYEKKYRKYKLTKVRDILKLK